MAIPQWRQKQIAQKEAAREERYRDRMADLMGLTADDQRPHVPALCGDAGIVCLACYACCGATVVALMMPVETLCDHCGKRLDHVLRKEPR